MDPMDDKLQFYARLQIYRRERKFGPGVASLMKLVRERSSLTAACKEMHMAYSKAWKIMNQAEADFGFPLMEGTRGGEHGGKTELTAEGEVLLEAYLAFDAEAQVEIERLFEKHFKGFEQKIQKL